MSTDNPTGSRSYADLNEEERDDLAARVIAQLETDPDTNLPRRDLLKGAALLGTGAAIGTGGAFAATGQVAADASTTDTDGDIGTPTDRVDAFLDGADANSIDTDEAAIKSQFGGTVLNVAEYGAPSYWADSASDGTAEVQAAINDLGAHGGTLVFPYPVRVTSTIDATNMSRLRLWTPVPDRMASAGEVRPGLFGQTTGTPVLDLVGTKGFEIACGLSAPNEAGTGHPSCAMLLARSTADNDAEAGKLVGATIFGKFTSAGIYNVSKEQVHIDRSSIISVECPAYVAGYNNRDNLTSQFATIEDASTTGSVDSSVEHTITNSVLKGYINLAGEPVVYLSQDVGDFEMQTSHMLAVDATAAVEFDTGPENMEGPLIFENNRVETGGGSVDDVYVKTGLNELRGVQIRGGVTVGTVSGALVDFQTAGGNTNQFTFWGGGQSVFNGNNGLLFDSLYRGTIVTSAVVANVDAATRIDGSFIVLPGGSSSISRPATVVDSYISQGGWTQMPLQSIAPTAPQAGQWYLDDGTNTASGNAAVRLYNGTAWVDQN